MSRGGLTVKTRVKLSDKGKGLKRKVIATGFKSLGQAAGVHRKIARNMVKEIPGPAPEGTPVRSPTGLLRTSIIYAITGRRTAYVVGTAESVIGTVGQLHEFGGEVGRRKGRGFDTYAPRPFMSASLEKIQPRLNRFWRGALRT
jgi:phage gpG-like protein